MDDYNVSPFNRVPAVILLIAAAIIGIELYVTFKSFGPAGNSVRLIAYQKWSFVPEIWQHMIGSRDFQSDYLVRLVSYPFIHARLFDALFATALFVALGKGVADSLSPWAVVIIFLTASISGAVAYGTFADTRAPLASAFTVNFGMIGAITYVRMLNLRKAGENQILAFRLIGMFMLIRLIWGIYTMFAGSQQDMQWVAELAAFVASFIVTGLLEPKGWPGLMEALRRR
ncbi:MAG: rhomboid family intramembrane serine protease [Deltaproteobacteria bacterium]